MFLDEVKPYSIKYGTLLLLLDNYKIQLHSRYSNVYSLYEEVHITSIYTPDEIYGSIVERQNQEVDSLYQLTRRITEIIYHFKDETGYHAFGIPPGKYKSYEDLKRKAQPESDGFKPLDAPSPFDEPEKPEYRQEFLNLDEADEMPFD